MAELDTKPDFGIENTMSIDTGGQGDINLLNNLFAPETSTADPDTVTSIDSDGKVDPTKLAGKEDDVPDNVAADPDALTKFLLGDDGWKYDIRSGDEVMIDGETIVVDEYVDIVYGVFKDGEYVYRTPFQIPCKIREDN